MSRVEIFEKLTAIFHDVFDDNELIIGETTSAKDIDEWDSLMHINLIMAVEAEFAIKFSMDDISRMKNVGEMVDIIKERLEKTLE